MAQVIGEDLDGIHERIARCMSDLEISMLAETGWFDEGDLQAVFEDLADAIQELQHAYNSITLGSLIREAWMDRPRWLRIREKFDL
jgi:hypothetical protein